MRPLVLALLLASVSPAAAASPDLPRWQAQAARVTITRDDYGIPHIKGKSDADAVFGMVYAQAEDDWNRVETNFINAQGRLAETEGDSAVWRDLRMQLFIDPAELKRDYAASPPWLKALMTAWADGLNYYLATHPQVKPRVITHFEPWMALSFSEGSIGADYEKVSIPGVEAFYGQKPQLAEATPALPPDPQGSNGFAIAPSHSANGHALLYINPHTTFYFRSEAQVQSGEGLDAYGASTWGQFFIYQGFNRHMGWMHTTSGLDSVDEFALEVRKGAGGRMEYRYGSAWEPFRTRDVALKVRQTDGSLATRTVTTFHSRHGPVTRREGDKWIATALMLKPRAALEQSFLRTKARDIPAFIKVSERRANSSNNSLLADDRGNIAFLMPQFVPRRDTRFDYKKPVDGSDPATRWQGEHTLAELPQVINPANGWVMNVNNRPWTAAGADSPKADAYPRYMDSAGWNPREPHAIKVLTATPKFTTETLIAAGYDPWLPAFSVLIPTLAAAYDRLPATDPRRAQLAAPVAALKAWDCRTGEASTEAGLAVYWAEALAPKVTDVSPEDYDSVIDKLAKAPTDDQRLTALSEAVAKLTADFGSWQTPWGQINRLQRLSGAIDLAFDDAKPSTPIGFGSGQWGALAAFAAAPAPNTKRRYGFHGNSFIAAVDFGPQGPTARAVSVGGQSGNPTSPHFFDQAERYRTHDFRTVVLEATGKSYHPGE